MMRRFLTAAAALAVATPAGAQLFDGMRLQTGPQFVQYRIAGPIDETISELAIPIFAIVPIGSRFSVDVGTSYAQSRVRFAGGESTVSGLTDTQLRANYSLGNDFIVLTAGVNLPTGETTVALDQLLAASRIANDFLSFPISSMGAGTAVTGGMAIARPLGTWNVGAGGSVRLASAFDPVQPESGPVPRYQPGNEYKLRVGADRPVGAGQFALGLTFSTFGEDDFAGSLYNTGDRYVGQVGYARPVSFGTFTIGAWNLYRSAGQLIGGVDVPWDNIVNASTSLAINTRGPTIEPSVQVRSWFQRVGATSADAARTDRSTLAELGLRARVAAGPFAVFPGVGFAFGGLAAGADDTARLTGFRGTLGVQIR
ncbi:MAG: hypothetical protein H0X64_09195 [Gemmatimonadaceae bacterium]|nr:hypothetical protein [Gemmatimonadaceae bacterium]